MSVKMLMTAEEFLLTDGEGPRELIRGEVVQMTPPGTRHGYICANVVLILGTWVRQSRSGYVIGNDAGVVTERDPDTVRGPDCQFISAKRLPGGIPARGYAGVPPDLAVEVLSPGNRWTEISTKIDEYLASGVLEVWIVDPENESIQSFRGDRGPVRLAGDKELTSDVLPGFRSVVQKFFS